MAQKSSNTPTPLQSIVAGAAAGGIESLTTVSLSQPHSHSDGLGS